MKFKDLAGKLSTRWKWGLGGLAAVLVVYFLFFRSAATGTTYVSLQQAKTGSLDVTVSADGSVDENQSVDLTPKTSGTVTSIGVKEGDTVQTGQLLLSLDSYDEGISVRQAELDLESAQVKLKQIQDASSASDVKTAENALSQAQQDEVDVTTKYNENKADDQVTLENAQDDLDQERVNAYSLTASAFAELPTTLTTVDDVLHGRDYSSGQDNIDYYHDLAVANSDVQQKATSIENDYEDADATYHTALNSYNTVDISSDTDTILTLLDNTYSTAEQFSVLLKNMDVFLLSLQDQLDSKNQDIPAELTSQISTVEDEIATLNPQLSKLSTEVQSFKSLEQDLTDAERALTDLDTNYSSDLKQAQLTVESKQLSLDDLNDGPDSNDVKAQEISVEKAQASLDSAENKYDDLFVRAPFAGVITTKSVDLGQSVSSGTTVFTLVSSEKLVDVSFNEVDVSQVKVGQTGTATFDALPGVTAPVTLAFVSEVHDSTSSVVQYESHLSLDKPVDGLKEGMSAHVTLTLQHVDSALLVPKTALQTRAGKTYVEVATEGSTAFQERTLYPRTSVIISSKEVTVGVSGSDQVQILSGLSEGDWVVSYSAAAQVSAPVTTRPSGAFGEGAINNGAGRTRTSSSGSPSTSSATK